MFLGSYPLELGAITPIFYAFREREELQAVMEEASGGRMHYMFNRVGGLKEDLPAGWLDRVAARRGLGPTSAAATWRRSSSGNEILRGAHPRGRRADAASWSPPTECPGRSPAPAGVDLDLRRDEPYLAYAELFAPGGPGRVVTRSAGDCLARLEVLLEQVHVSAGPGRGTAWTGCGRCQRGRSTCGSPRCCGCRRAHLYTGPRTRWASTATTWSRGATRLPWRLKLRSASFNNVSVLSRLLPGCLIADMVAILGSMFFVVGDVDK